MKNLFRKKILPLCMVIFLMGSLIPVMSFAASVSVYASDPYLKVGETLQLGYETSPSGVSLTWTSSNTSVATVSSTGLVKAKAVGYITARATYTNSSGVSTTETIYTDDGDEWLNYYLTYIESGNNISSAVSLATQKTGSVYIDRVKDSGVTEKVLIPSFPLYYIGDDSQYLN